MSDDFVTEAACVFDREGAYGRAFRSGDVVVVQPRRPIGSLEHERLQAKLDWLTRDTGVTFVVLVDADVVEVKREDG